ncbi:MAG: hypothetical protein WDO19_19160 [Bacteroidota bacterium]
MKILMLKKHLGYATSRDGYTWTRYAADPIYSSGWVEDMCVIKSGGVYYMFAEGRGRHCAFIDIAGSHTLDRAGQSYYKTNEW